MSRVQSRALLDVVLLLLLASAALTVVAALQPVRPFAVLAAACFVPGVAILTRLDTGKRLIELPLAIGLSIAVEIIGSSVLAWSGWWHPDILGIVLGAASAGLLLIDLARLGRS